MKLLWSMAWSPITILFGRAAAGAAQKSNGANTQAMASPGLAADIVIAII